MSYLSRLMDEDGTYLLQESGFYILLDFFVTTWTAVVKATTTWTKKVTGQ